MAIKNWTPSAENPSRVFYFLPAASSRAWVFIIRPIVHLSYIISGRRRLGWHRYVSLCLGVMVGPACVWVRRPALFIV